jgi:hypothetical protein
MDAIPSAIINSDEAKKLRDLKPFFDGMGQQLGSVGSSSCRDSVAACSTLVHESKRLEQGVAENARGKLISRVGRSRRSFHLLFELV